MTHQHGGNVESISHGHKMCRHLVRTHGKVGRDVLTATELFRHLSTSKFLLPISSNQFLPVPTIGAGGLILPESEYQPVLYLHHPKTEGTNLGTTQQGGSFDACPDIYTENSLH